jgi:thymidylate kinase
MIIAIEGPDGCGKTTQAKMLFERLEKEGYSVRYVRPLYAIFCVFPKNKATYLNFLSPRKLGTTSVTKMGNRLYSILRIFLSLIGLSYAFLIYMYLKTSNKNRIIICDRYFYQFLFDLFGNLSEKIVKAFPKPTITFFLDGELDVIRSRMSLLDSLASLKYYAKVINFYRRIAKACNFVRIDATLKKDEINEIIFNIVREVIRSKNQ